MFLKKMGYDSGAEGKGVDLGVGQNFSADAFHARGSEPL
jgi:hypothetical protein